MSSIAQRENTKEELIENLKKDLSANEGAFKNDKDPTRFFPQVEEIMNQIMSNKLSQEETTFFINTMLPRYVTALLRRSDVSNEIAHKMARFFHSVLSFCIHSLGTDEPEIIETIYRLVASTTFFIKYDGPDEIPDESKKPEEIIQKSKQHDISTYLYSNVVLLVRHGALKFFQERIEDTQKPIPILVLRAYLKIFTKIINILQPNIVKQFVNGTKTRIQGRVLGMTEEELKTEDKKTLYDIANYFDGMMRWVHPKQAPEIVEKFQLQIALKCLQSGNFDKRFAGLNDLREIASALLRKYNHDTKMDVDMWINDKFFRDFLKEHKIIENLCSNAPIELMRRSGDIFKFLAVSGYLEKKHLDMLWDASLGKHESVVHVIYGILGDLANSLKIADIDYLFEKVLQTPTAQYDLTTLSLLKQVTIPAINTSQPSSKSKRYGLDVFWDLMQDDSNCTAEVANAASTSLLEFLQWEPCYLWRTLFMERCLDNLKQGKSVPRSLNTLGRIIQTFPEKKNKKSDHTVSAVIEWLDTLKLLDLYFADVVSYKNRVKETLSKLSPEERQKDPMLYTFVGSPSNWNNSHFWQVKERLDFLEYILARSKLMLSIDQINVFWNCFIVNAVHPAERDLAFKWLENARGTHHEFPAFTDEATSYLFTTKVPELDVATLTVNGFAFFEFYFRYVNWKGNRFQQSQNPVDYTVLSFDLIGLDMLWKIALQAVDPTVGKQAIASLIQLHRNLSPELRNNIGKHRENFVQSCMTYLSQASHDLGVQSLSTSQGHAVSSPLDAIKSLIIDRCLDLLKSFLDEYEIKAGLGTRKHGQKGSGAQITLFLQLMNGPKHQFELNTSDTFATFRQKAAEVTGQPGNSLRFIVSGKEMKDDSETLAFYKLVNNTTIHCINRRPPKDNMETDQPQQPEPQPKPAKPQEVVDETIFPSKIISKEEYFALLFKLLVFDALAGKVWELLMLLPTNASVASRLLNLNEKSNWDQLLDPNSTFKLLYSLQIVESLLKNDVDSPIPIEKAQRDQWLDQFYRLGGVSHLVKVLLTSDFHSKNKGSKRKTCLALLIKVINYFLISEPLDVPQVNPQDDNMDVTPTEDAIAVPNSQLLLQSVSQPSLLAFRLFELSYLSATDTIENPPQPVQPQTQLVRTETEVIEVPQFSAVPLDEDSAFVHQAMKLLLSTTLRLNPASSGTMDLQASLSIVNDILKHPSFEAWLWTLCLGAQTESIRKDVSQAIYQICKQTNSVQNPPHAFVLKHLLTYLPRIEAHNSVCEEYFDILNKLISDSCDGVAGGKPADFVQLLYQLVELINKHPIVEARNSKIQDYTLGGFLNITRTILSKDPSLKFQVGSSQRGGLLQELFHCLFDIPTARNHGPLAPPKCKQKKSRRSAFALLIELARDCPQNFEELIQKLIEQHKDDKRTQWQYIPGAYEKSATGYVGLRNLGATCYMNSLMQQLFMVPPFRAGLLSVPMEQKVTEEVLKDASVAQLDDEAKEKLKIEKLKDNILYEMQELLSYLQESEKKYFDTREFCKSYKYDGQPVNPSIQMDADEFFNMLFDKIDSLVKGTPQEHLLKEYFGGTLASQIISKECPHISEREESFFTLSLDVKGKKNLTESLNLYVQGDLLEGENKYQCGTCTKKVDARKRSCIKSLPDNLIIHQKRFEFDFEFMKRIKVNDYFEFPMELDLEPYTREGLARREIPADQLADEFKQTKPDGYYKYELAGILVHTGTAEMGHYYSFIRERIPGPNGERIWYQFNDTDVEPFDPREIAKQCFGGTESVWQMDQQGRHGYRNMEKMNSAYMLFYERVFTERTTEAKQTFSSSEALAKAVPSNIFSKIWNENMAFLHEKNIFDPDYFSSLWSTVMMETVQPPISIQDFSLPYQGLSDPLFQRIVLGTKFIFATLSHAKERGGLKAYVDQLKGLYSRHIPACKWFLEHNLVDNVWIRQILFHCNVNETREIVTRLITHIVGVLAPSERSLYKELDPLPDSMETDGAPAVNIDDNPLVPCHGISKSLVIRFIESIFSLLKEATPHWHNFTQLFLIIRDFAELGSTERLYLAERNAIPELIDFLLNEESPFHAITSAKHKKVKMGDKFSNPNFTYLLDTVSLLARSCVLDQSKAAHVEGPIRILSEMDKKAIYCDKFWPKVLGDNINPEASAKLGVHFAWEDMNMSTMLMDHCTRGINQSTEKGFAPLFQLFSQLLSLADSLQPQRVDMGMENLLKVVYDNLKYKGETIACIGLITELGTQIPLVNQWLWEKKEKWLDPFFVTMSWNEGRENMVKLIQSFIPEYPKIPSPAQELPLRSSVPVDFVVPEETQARVHTLYRYFLSKMTVCSGASRLENKNDNDWQAYKGLQFWRFLRWFARGPTEAAIFSEHFDKCMAAFGQLNGYNQTCDVTKMECTYFIFQMLSQYPENMKLLASSDKYWAGIIECYISLNSSDKYKQYNNNALVPLFQLMVLLATTNEKFLEKFMAHSNFDWSLRFLLFETYDYPDLAPVMMNLIKLASNHSAQWRATYIAKVFANEKIPNYPNHMLPVLVLLLKTPDDALLFCKQKGLDFVAGVVQRIFKDRTLTPEIGNNIEQALQIILTGASWLVEENLTSAQKAVKSSLATTAEAKASFTLTILNYMRHPDYIANKPSDFAPRVVLLLVSLDQSSMQAAVHYLQNAYFPPTNQNTPQDGYPTKAIDESFVAFVQKLVDIGISQGDKKLLQPLVNLAVSLAKETTSNPFTLQHTVGHLLKLSEMKGVSDILKSNKDLDAMVTKLLTADYHNTGLPQLDNLFKALTPLDRMQAETRQSIFSLIANRLDADIEAIKRDPNNPDDSRVLSLISGLRALVLALSGETRKEFLAQFSSRVGAVIQLAQVIKTPRSEDLSRVLAALQ